MIEPPQVSYDFPAETGLEDKIRVKKIICVEKSIPAANAA